MNPYTQFALLSASTLRMLPHILWYLRFKKTIDADLERYGEGRGSVTTFIKVCTRQKVFRNLFYYRLGEYRSVFIKWLMPGDPTLHITCPEIGPGCHLEHTYATYLNADRIGRNGATVFGHVTIGDNVTIGAGAVVSNDVPPGCTVKGNPAVIVSRKAAIDN